MKELKAKHFIFVYGTLKKGFQNHNPALLSDSFIGIGKTVLAYPLYISLPRRVPILVPTPRKGLVVQGELYAISNTVRDELDRIESTHLSTGYKRLPLQVQMDSGKIIEAEAYFKSETQVAETLGGPLSDYPFDPAYIPRIKPLL